ncbi:Killer toxin [Naviculisporaceae sp. PSN 640]
MHAFQAHSLSALVLGLLAATSHGLGINCRGSGMCSIGTDGLGAENLRNSINGVDDNKWFRAGEHIACDPRVGPSFPIPWTPQLGGGICAFIQNIDGMDGRTVKRLAQAIVDHKCKTCGSAPLRDNDVKYGQLTFNYVEHPKCEEGICN